MDDRSAASARALFVERSVSGHRLFYVGLLAQETVRRGWKPVLAVPSDMLDSDEIRLHLKSLSGQLELIGYDRVSLKDIELLSKQIGARLTVVADGDWLMKPLALRLRWNGCGKLSVLVMREKAQAGISSAHRSLKNLAKFALFMKARYTRNVSLSVLKSATWKGKSRFSVAIDPIRLTASASDGEDLLQAWGIDRGRKWFGVLGAISSRKNVHLIADALIRTGRDDVGLIIAGEIDPDARAEIALAIERMTKAGLAHHTVDRLLIDEELDALVHAVDCIVLAHSNEGPSGLLGKAAYAGTRVVASGAHSLREDLAASEELGEWCPLEIGSLSETLNKSVARQRPKPLKDSSEGRFVSKLLDIPAIP